MTSGPRLAATLAFVLGATAARGDISGFVRVANSGTPGTPIPGARVHIRADSSVVAVAGADGGFTLAANPAGAVELDASIPYSRAAAVNYLIGGATASNGDVGVDIRLDVLPGDNPSYQPPTADICGSCHRRFIRRGPARITRAPRATSGCSICSPAPALRAAARATSTAILTTPARQAFAPPATRRWRTCSIPAIRCSTR